MHDTRDSVPRYSSPETPSAAGLDIGAILGYLAEKKWIFIWCAVIFGLIGTILSFTLTRMYTSTATVLVQDPPNVVPGQENGVAKDVYAAPEALKAVEGSFKSDTLLLRIVKANHLDLTHPAFQAKPSEPPMDDAKLIKVMSGRFNAKAQRGSRLIDVEVSDENPALAQKLAQSAIDEYVKLMYGSSGQLVATANGELAKEADAIRGRLEKSEQQLQAYREKYGTTSIEEAKNLSQEKLRQLNLQLTDVKANRIRLESQLGGLTDVDHAPLSRLMGIQSIAAQPDVGLLQKSLNDASAQMAVAKKNYGPRHPGYTSMESAVESVRSQLSSVVHNYGRALLNDYRAARAAEASLTQQMANVDKESVTLAGISIPYAVLEREVQANKTMYDQLLERMRKNTVDQNVNQMNIQQVQYPVLSSIDKPKKPNVPFVIGLSIIGGLALALIYVLVSRAKDSSFRSIDEAERTLQLPALAAVPLAKGKRKKGKQSALFQLDAPASPQAEATRDLRTALAHLPSGQPKAVLFTSSVPGEGKSFCAVNYAIALAHQGLRTVLLDGDLRRPTLAGLLGVAPDRPGFADYLSGRVSASELAHSTKVENLSIVTAGKNRSRPAELIAQKTKINDLLSEFKSYDCVVIDSAPLLVVSDSLLLAPAAEAVVLIVRARKTQQKEITRSVHLMNQVGAFPVGFVLNQIPLEHTYSDSSYAGSYASGSV